MLACTTTEVKVMNSSGVVGAILAVVLVVAVLVVYSLHTVPAPTTTVTSTRIIMISGSNYTVTVSGGATRTTPLGQVQLRSGVGSQPVLCSWASYFFPDTITSSNASAPAQTVTVNNYTTTIIENTYPQATTHLGIYASVTNATQSVGYVVATTTAPNYAPSSGWIVTTCTYLP